VWFYGFKSSITAGEGEYKGIWGLDKIMKKETKFEKSEKPFGIRGTVDSRRQRAGQPHLSMGC